MERSIWRQYARTAHQLNLVIVVLDTAYVLATWHTGPHRLLLLALNVAAAGGLALAVLLVPEERIAKTLNRSLATIRNSRTLLQGICREAIAVGVGVVCPVVGGPRHGGVLEAGGAEHQHGAADRRRCVLPNVEWLHQRQW